MATVVAAMSGGVDSSVTAGLLIEQGHDVIGVHMKLHDANPNGGSGTCCGLDDAMDARKVADRLGIPFYVLDLQEAFKKGVMDPFAEEYRRGRTPNPCILCNGVLKFRVLMARAMALGATHLATGHYCRVDGPTLAMAVDRAKDQSYFLFPITPKALARTMFPLGGMSKPEVRAHAERMGLITANKAESQDVCFLPNGDHGSMVAATTDEDGSGEIVDEQGRVLGHHDGYWRYTVGQRRGLGVALGHPAYVLKVEPSTRRVVIGGLPGLLRQGLTADGCNWFIRPEPGRRYQVRIRHRGPLHDAQLRLSSDGDLMEVTLSAPARAISPGQAAVVYDGDRVLGGGWIRSAASA